MDSAERRNGHNPEAYPLSELASLGKVTLQRIDPFGFFITTPDEIEIASLRRGQKPLSDVERRLLPVLHLYVPHSDISSVLGMGREVLRDSLEALRERVGIRQEDDPLLKNAFNIVHNYLTQYFPQSRPTVGFVTVEGQGPVVLLLFRRTVREHQLGIPKPEIEELISGIRTFSTAEEAMLHRLERLPESLSVRKIPHKVGVTRDVLDEVTSSLIERLRGEGREDLARKLAPFNKQ